METGHSTVAFPKAIGIFSHDALEAPSEQMRLIKFVQAGPTDCDQLCIELSTWNVNEAPEYKAISYTWGEGKSPRLIQINGKQFHVRNNCHYALWQTWLHWPDGYVWIDSICINQVDADEKGFQVQRMSDTYAKAVTVLVCVGAHKKESERLMAYILENSRSKKDSYWPFERTSQDSRTRNLRSYSITLVSFCSRPYWRRLWIIQELAYAKSKVILCGEHRVDWECLIVLENDYNPSFTPVHELLYLEPSSISVSHAMQAFGSYNCSDVRDRLYGMLGIIEWPENSTMQLKADYNKSPAEILLQVMNEVDIQDIEDGVAELYIALEAFAVNTTTSQHLQELVAYAKDADSRDDIARPKLLHPTYKPLALAQSIQHKCCQISRNSKHQLTAPSSKDDLNWFMVPDVLKGTGFSIYPWRDGDLPAFSQPVYSELALTALVCAAAREGDILVSSVKDRPENLLVLRRIDEYHYEIIGQGLTVNGYCIDTDEQYKNTNLVLHLTAPEILLLWGQDMIGFERRGEKAVYDPDAQLQRLRTAVILDSAPVPRASFMSKGNAQD